MQYIVYWGPQRPNSGGGAQPPSADPEHVSITGDDERLLNWIQPCTTIPLKWLLLGWCSRSGGILFSIQLRW